MDRDHTGRLDNRRNMGMVMHELTVKEVAIIYACLTYVRKMVTAQRTVETGERFSMVELDQLIRKVSNMLQPWRNPR